MDIAATRIRRGNKELGPRIWGVAPRVRNPRCNQHTLINLLNDSGLQKPLSSRLEAILISYTGGERSSRGILQGMFPSDLFGNFYLVPIDRYLKEYGVLSARYVDDLYVFVESVDAAERVLRALIPALRSYDLVINEAKALIMPKSALITEERVVFAFGVARFSAPHQVRGVAARASRSQLRRA